MSDPLPFRFDRFVLDPAERRLTCDGAAVELNARYLDALTLLVAAGGGLVTKDRFMAEVWRGVPVTDEALTQCVRTLRRVLGDDAAAPRFIATVPKHGYRFVAALNGTPTPAPPRTTAWHAPAMLAGAGTVGGGIAGVIGGLLYGFVGAAQPLAPGVASISVLLVLLSLCVLVALLGAAGVAGGIALATRGAPPAWRWSIAGGAIGGMLVGAVVKLLGLDAFALLLGWSPGDITGPIEGAALGGAIGFAVWLAVRSGAGVRQAAGIAALCGGVSGGLLCAAGGRLMAGSLQLLAQASGGTRLRLDRIGALLGEDGFGSRTLILTGALEGALFVAGVTTALLLAHRQTAAA